MIGDASQFELDDELSSAYLDDELSPEERAAIERRLAADPAAQQMLDELRHVSQAVRTLPPESVGRDLRESILQRAGSSSTPAGVPKVTVGRSVRGWVWASLAVAAALVIAVFVPDEPKDTDLPAVAQRSREIGDRPVLRAAPEAAPAETAVADATSEDITKDTFAAVPPPAPNGEAQPDGNFALKAPAAASPVTETPAAPSSLTLEPTSETAIARAGASPPPADKALAQPEEEPLLVVRVLAKRDALDRGTFEQLLARNGVQVDPQPAAASVTASGTLDTATADHDASAATAEKSKQDEQEGVEFLVEAPPDTIFNCVAGLNKDSQNFLGLEVDSVSAEEKSAVTSLGAGRKQVDDLAKYNRGIVPRRGGESRSRGEAFYYRSQADSQVPSTDSFGGQAAARVELKHELQQQAADVARGSNARARRLLRYDERAAEDGVQAEDRELAERLARVKTSPAQRGIGQLKDAAPADNANMQVLFVLNPSDEPAASPATENPPQ